MAHCKSSAGGPKGGMCGVWGSVQEGLVPREGASRTHAGWTQVGRQLTEEPQGDTRASDLVEGTKDIDH